MSAVGDRGRVDTDDDPRHIRVRRSGRVGRLTLDRPAAINALTLRMIRTLDRVLRRWLVDPTVEVVLLDGNGARGFCAGGDIRVVYDDARDRQGAAERLWRAEYILDALVGGYPKPIVSVLDGITMGGGVGIGCHGPHRIVTERSLLAMPEVSIGLAPDVGGLLLLARAPGRLGTHLALTAGRVGAADALLVGLADAVVPTDRLAQLVPLLERCDPADAIAALRTPPERLGPAPLAADQGWIDRCYAADEVTTILDRLRTQPDPGARAAAAAITRMPPLALCVTLRGLEQARRADALAPVLVQDFRVSCRFLDTPDLVSGIRAAVIDKSSTPTWSPAHLDAVSASMVDRHFASLGADDLVLDPVRTG